MSYTIACFLDRVAELQRLRELVAAPGVVTVHGPGGSGKSSLARRLVAESGAAWTWCGMGHVEGVEGACAYVAEAVARQGPSDGLVFDDVDHLVDRGPEFSRWVEAEAGNAPVVVTSTTRLETSTERVITVGGLPLDAARELFVHHVRRHRPGFTLDATILARVTDVVEGLDRLPRPIVLAAGFLEVLSLDELHRRVRSDAAASPFGAAHGPSQWVTAAWSQLDVDQQYVLAQCAIFSGDFAMPDVAAVVRTRTGVPPPVAAFKTFAALALVEAADVSAHGGRLHVLRATRQLLLNTEQWAGVREEVAERHATWYAADKWGGADSLLVVAPAYQTDDLHQAGDQLAEQDPVGSGRARVLAAISDASWGNRTLSALAEVEIKAKARGDVAGYVVAALNRMGAEFHRGVVRRARQTLRPALDLAAGLPPGQRATLFASAAFLEECLGDRAAAAVWGERARAAVDAAPPTNQSGEALLVLGAGHLVGGAIDRSLSLLQAAEPLSTAPWTRALLLYTRCGADGEAGGPISASAEALRPLETDVPPGYPAWQRMARVQVRHTRDVSPDLERALREAATEAEAQGCRLFRQWIDAYRGWVLWDLGETARAIATTRAAVLSLREMHAVSIAVPPALALSWWLAVEGEPGEGTRWWRWATDTQSVSAPLARGLRAVFGAAHPELDAGDARVAPVQERWARIRIARAMVRRVRQARREAPLELVELAEGGGGLVCREGSTVQVSVAQFALLARLAERWTEDADLPRDVQGFAASASLLPTLPFETPYPENWHLKQLVKRTRERLKSLGVAIEGRRGFGYRLSLPDDP